jgi:predicted AAA+ superfamily ATPase
MAFKRDLLEKLVLWQKSTNRKPLVIEGARQVGKTWLMKEFGRTCFEQFTYINFEELNLQDVFAEKNPHAIIQQLALISGNKIDPQRTLLIFDEIQECKPALNALKYFYEQIPELAIVAAGSLLGVSMAAGDSFPVGKVDHMTLYPLTFKEYLSMVDVAMYDYLSNRQVGDAIVNTLEERIKRHFDDYRVCGGMPEAAMCMANGEGVEAVEKVQSNILKDYQLDFSKHASKTIIPRIGHIYRSIPSQLSKENRKFVYQLVKQGARAREYEDALQWLRQAGLIHQVYLNKTPNIPLTAYDDLSAFKIYLSDIGLLRKLAEVPVAALVTKDDVIGYREFKGAFAENYVLQSLSTQSTVNLRYWTSNNSAEVDFLLQYDTHILPIEVKSGKSTSSRSLTLYNAEKHPILRIRYSDKELKLDDNLLNIPLYMADWTFALLKAAIAHRS